MTACSIAQLAICAFDRSPVFDRMLSRCASTVRSTPPAQPVELGEFPPAAHQPVERGRKVAR